MLAKTFIQFKNNTQNSKKITHIVEISRLLNLLLPIKRPTVIILINLPNLIKQNINKIFTKTSI